MEFFEIIAILAAIISAFCLALIQIRRVIRGELSIFGPKAFIDAAKIKLDGFEMRLLLISGIAIIFCIVFALISND